MDRREVQRRLVASETFCFSGTRDFPKVYETLTRHHVEPELSLAADPAYFGSASNIDDGYEVTWDLEIDEITISALERE
ncbi:MAG TPA: hypothetical protein PK324_04540 [Nocardioides sp.]|nr:hypothetical protein [Nocardioides sp.]